MEIARVRKKEMLSGSSFMLISLNCALAKAPCAGRAKRAEGMQKVSPPPVPLSLTTTVFLNPISSADDPVLWCCECSQYFTLLPMQHW